MLGHALKISMLKIQISNEYGKGFSRVTIAGS
jgi:hypothetical protein